MPLPDLTLLLDHDGVIRQATSASGAADDRFASWLGRPWTETVADVGGDKIKRMIEDARVRGVSGFRQITQRFPGGLELPMEFTTVRLGKKAGLLAIGKNLEAVAELQSRLIAAQQAMERDYWKLREVETRYRVLFNASSEAVLLVRASNLRIVEANRAALQALDLSPPRRDGSDGREFVSKIAADDRETLRTMLARVREHGAAPAIVAHLGGDRKPWLVRASLMAHEPDAVLLMQLVPVGRSAAGAARNEPPSLEDLIERAADGLAVVDADGIIRRANQTFLEMVEVGAKAAVTGERLGRWLWRPGADIAALLANVQRYGTVRRFTTTLHGDLGTDREVELSASGSAPANGDPSRAQICVLIRDVGRRLPAPEDGNALLSALGAMEDQIGKTSLAALVRDAVSVVEQHYIKAALKMAAGNRTAAAGLLGLSRQSLYAKLNRYQLEGERAAPPETGD
jgi:transcriptional regulator PpsR